MFLLGTSACSGIFWVVSAASQGRACASTPAAQDWLLRALTEAKKSCGLVFLAVLLSLLGQAPAALCPPCSGTGNPSQKCVCLSLEVTLGSPVLSSGLCPSKPCTEFPCHRPLPWSPSRQGPGAVGTLQHPGSPQGSSSTGPCPHAPQQGSGGHPGKDMAQLDRGDTGQHPQVTRRRRGAARALHISQS